MPALCGPHLLFHKLNLACLRGPIRDEVLRWPSWEQSLSIRKACSRNLQSLIFRICLQHCNASIDQCRLCSHFALVNLIGVRVAVLDSAAHDSILVARLWRIRSSVKLVPECHPWIPCFGAPLHVSLNLHGLMTREISLH
jgi:hypothetical protein